MGIYGCDLKTKLTNKKIQACKSLICCSADLPKETEETMNPELTSSAIKGQNEVHHRAMRFKDSLLNCHKSTSH